MSSAQPQYTVGSAVLGYVGLVATWRRHREPSVPPMLIIQSSGDTDENGYTPPQSVTIQSVAGLLALRDAIDAVFALPKPAELKWVAVADARPEADEEVLVWLKSEEDWCSAVYDGDDFVEIGGAALCVLTDVTHWARPEGPKP